MEQRNLGRSGLRVSALALGCNNFGGRLDTAGAAAILDTALDLGITFLDTADVYPAARMLAQTESGQTSASGDGAYGASETILGEILGPRRKDLVVSTKFGRPMDAEETRMGGSRRYVMSAVEDSLRRLRTDWIDLYQLHIPDPLTPMEETLRAVDDLVAQGKVRYVGLSTLPAWELTDAHWIAKVNGFSPVVSVQEEYSLIRRQDSEALIPALTELGISLLPFFPLSSGMLTGKYRRDAAPPTDSRLNKMRLMGDQYLTTKNFDDVDRLAAFAERHGCSLLELALGWLLAQPVVGSVLAGATKPEQLRQNAAAAQWRPTPAIMAELHTLLEDL